MFAWPIAPKRADDDRGQRGEDDDLLPSVGLIAERIERNAHGQRHARQPWVPMAKKVVTGVGAPS